MAEAYISIGYDVMAIRYYTMALQMVYYYDYLLTLPDEIKYAWTGKKTWIFSVFILNRYYPALYQTWVFFVGFLPQFTHQTCDKTAFIQILTFFLCTLLAQVSITVRLYALTLGRKRIVAFFSAITFTQVVIGVYTIVITAHKPAQRLPLIPLQAYDLCIFSRSPRFELVYMSLSLFFDAMAFSVIVFVSFGFKAGLSSQGGRPSIIRTIVEDSTLYFLVIFSSHLVSFLMLLVARPSVQLLPSAGNLVLLPIMISRLMLSLKKASRTKDNGWTADAFSRTRARTITQMEFGKPPSGPGAGDGTMSDEVVPSDLSDSQVRGRSGEGTV